MTILNFIKRLGSVITSPITFRDSSFETAMVYDRKDGKRIEFVVVHLPNISGEGLQEPYLALCSRSIKRNPNCTPNALLNLSMEEARWLKRYLNNPQVSVWIDEEEEEA